MAKGPTKSARLTTAKAPVTAKGEKAMAQEVRESEQDAPILEPLYEREGATALSDVPMALPEELLAEQAVQLPGEAPAMIPPTEEEIEIAEIQGVAAWHNGKKITALWSSKTPRNSFILVQGMGWKKLCNANDSCVVSMTMMAAHAEQTNATVNIRTESDGMVHQIYVW